MTAGLRLPAVPMPIPMALDMHASCRSVAREVRDLARPIHKSRQVECKLGAYDQTACQGNAADPGWWQGTIEGRRDIAGGRKEGDRRAAGNAASGQCFTTLAFSADGAWLLAGGASK